MKIKEGDLFEIVYNPHFKIKGYYINLEKFGENSFILKYKNFISENIDSCVISKDTHIRVIGKLENHIYLITNTINGKQYIGRTCNSVEERLKNHFRESSKPYSQTALHKDMQIYKKENFIIEKLYSFYASRQRDANKIEQEFIKKYNTKIPNGYNIA